MGGGGEGGARADPINGPGRQVPCAGFTTSDPGASSPDQCTAAPGYYGGDGTSAATPCPAGYYCPGGGAVSRCPVGTMTAVGAASLAQCSVISGYYGG